MENRVRSCLTKLGCLERSEGAEEEGQSCFSIASMSMWDSCRTPFAHHQAMVVDDEQETRKGPWTYQEDMQLITCIDVYGEGRWSFIAQAAGLKRSGKSCRLRWVNYLRPDLKRSKITPEEERIIVELHRLWGNRWARIARKLPGRTDNEIKNYWRTHLKKRMTDQNSSSATTTSHLNPSSEVKFDNQSESSSYGENTQTRPPTPEEEEISTLLDFNDPMIRRNQELIGYPFIANDLLRSNSLEIFSNVYSTDNSLATTVSCICEDGLPQDWRIGCHETESEPPHDYPDTTQGMAFTDELWNMDDNHYSC